MALRLGKACEASVVIDAPRDAVWELVSDPRNLPKWDRHITKVVGIPPGGIDVDTEYTTVVTFMGVSAHVDAEVLEFKPPEYARIRLSGPLIRGVVTTRVTPLDGSNSCRLEQDVDYDLRGGPLGKVASTIGVCGPCSGEKIASTVLVPPTSPASNVISLLPPPQRPEA